MSDFPNVTASGNPKTSSSTVNLKAERLMSSPEINVNDNLDLQTTSRYPQYLTTAREKYVSGNHLTMAATNFKADTLRYTPTYQDSLELEQSLKRIRLSHRSLMRNGKQQYSQIHKKQKQIQVLNSCNIDPLRRSQDSSKSPKR